MLLLTSDYDDPQHEPTKIDTMQEAPSEQSRQTDPQLHPTRHVWIDVARGLGVILVVLGHVLDGLLRANIFPQGAVASWMLYTLYTFHMPLFFFLAGLNVQHSLQRGTGPFLSSKLWTIAYPYVLWSLLQGGITMVFVGDANRPIDGSDLAAIWYRPIAQFWFLYALMICQILAVLVPSRLALITIAAVGLVVFLLLPVRPDLALTLHHLPFFVAGICLTRMVMNWKADGTTGWISFVLVALAFAAAVAAGGNVSITDWNGAASLPACILGITGMVLLCKLLDAHRHHWLAAVGVMSMTIYVMHILAASGIRIILLKLHVPTQAWLYLAIGTVVGVVVPMIAHVTLQRLHLLPALGLAPLLRRHKAAHQPIGQIATTK